MDGLLLEDVDSSSPRARILNAIADCNQRRTTIQQRRLFTAAW
ncbi:hypothetical protein PC116_g3394 [Phytophthora cactorum]|nr:hypothetical protein PC116_g3394 [Phytophthora cactorum]